MATVVNESTVLVDSAVGPLQVNLKEVAAFDIDDYVHMTLRSEAMRVQLKRRALSVNTKLAANRPPINIEEASAGGF